MGYQVVGLLISFLTLFIFIQVRKEREEKKRKKRKEREKRRKRKRKENTVKSKILSQYSLNESPINEHNSILKKKKRNQRKKREKMIFLLNFSFQKKKKKKKKKKKEKKKEKEKKKNLISFERSKTTQTPILDLRKMRRKILHQLQQRFCHHIPNFTIFIFPLHHFFFFDKK